MNNGMEQTFGCGDNNRANRQAHPCGRRKGPLFGLVLVAIGGLFIGEHLGLLGGLHPVQFWPLLLVVLGLSHVFSSGHPHKMWGGALIVGGLLGLMHTLKLVLLPWGLIWPIGLVAFGAYIIGAVLFFGRDSGGVLRQGEDGTQLIMGERQETRTTAEYEGEELSVAMGSYKLDLRSAQLKDNRATLKVKVTMGEMVILVPRHWSVEVDSKQALGGIENRTGDGKRGEGDDNAHLLVVEASVLMGSLEIRH